MSRTTYPGFPLRVEYALTDRGKELNDALEPVAQWGDRYAADIAAARARAASNGTSGR